MMDVTTASSASTPNISRAHSPASRLRPFYAHTWGCPCCNRTFPEIPVPAQIDLLLEVDWKGKAEVQAKNRLSKVTRMYVSDKSIQDQNTAIYTTIHAALREEAASGARSVHIMCNPPYVHDQLQGKAKVTKGQEAFFRSC